MPSFIDKALNIARGFSNKRKRKKLTKAKKLRFKIGAVATKKEVRALRKQRFQKGVIEMAQRRASR